MTVRTRIIRLLFTLFFCLYAVSPNFSRIALDNVFDTVHGPATATTVSRSVGLFFWELVCSQFAPAEDFAEAGSTVNVLVRKARAVVPKNDAAKLKVLEDLTMPEPQLFLAVSGMFQPLPTTETPTAVNDSFHLYSGLSPPSA